MRMLINVDVPALDSAIRFYTEALGLEHRRTLDDDVAELVGGSSTIYLLRNAPDTVAISELSEKRKYSRHWTPVHIDFVVDNLDEAVMRALNAGAIRESECVEWRGSKCITFADPFGHGFCLIEFRSKTYSNAQA